MRSVVLDNGLKILIQELHTAPLVSVWCWYRVGSGDELPGRTGVSHWVEHMNFKGTTNIPRDEMKGIVERFGGSWNGYTWIDQTTYVETAGKDALDTLLFIEAERMAHGLYEPEECESERTVIISELQGGENDPDQLLDTEVTATAFRAHPYRHPTIGWIDDLRSMSRDDLFGHYRRHYVPGNATLVVVGDVDTEDVLRRANRHFAGIDGGAPPPRVRPGEPHQIGERRVLLEREGTTAYLKFAWHAPAAREDDFFPMLVPTSEPFLYNISLTAMEGVTLSSLEDAAVREVGRVREQGLTDEDVTRAKRQLRARLVFDTDSVTNVAHQLGYFETVAGPGYFDSLASRVSEVTPAQVADVARRRLATEKRTVGWFRPVPSRVEGPVPSRVEGPVPSVEGVLETEG